MGPPELCCGNNHCEVTPNSFQTYQHTFLVDLKSGTVTALWYPYHRGISKSVYVIPSCFWMEPSEGIMWLRIHQHTSFHILVHRVLVHPWTKKKAPTRCFIISGREITNQLLIISLQSFYKQTVTQM